MTLQSERYEIKLDLKLTLNTIASKNNHSGLFPQQI